MTDNVTPIETTSQEVGHVPISYADHTAATIQIASNAITAAYQLKGHKRVIGMITRVNQRDELLVEEAENALLDIASDDLEEDFDELDDLDEGD